MRNAIACCCAAATIVAMLAILICRARDAARDMQSTNNLKQLSLSLLNYESAFGKLPMGTDPHGRHGWIYRCLPYIEASVLYKQIEPAYQWDSPNSKYLAPACRALLCI